MTEQTGVTRRNFLRGLGLATAGALAGGIVERKVSNEGQLQTPIVTGFIFKDIGRPNNPNGNIAGSYEGWTSSGPGEPKAEGVKVQLLKLVEDEKSAGSVVVAETKTNEKGTYFFAGVEPGRYRVNIEKAAFVQGDQEFEVNKNDTVVFASMFGIDSVTSPTK